MLKVTIQLNNNKELGTVEIYNKKIHSPATDYADYGILIRENKAFSDEVNIGTIKLCSVPRYDTSAMKLLYLALHEYYSKER